MKYQENGHDTFSDFVTLVCQEAGQPVPGQAPRSPTKLVSYYSTGMFPPAPAPPMARPVPVKLPGTLKFSLLAIINIRYRQCQSSTTHQHANISTPVRISTEHPSRGASIATFSGGPSTQNYFIHIHKNLKSMLTYKV